MSRNKTSILLFSDDKEISANLQRVLGGIEGATVNAQDLSVGEVNGKAVDMAAWSNIVLFATDPGNADDLSAIRSLNEKRGEHTVFIALTDEDIPLSRARALSDAGVDEVLPYPMADDELALQINKWIKKIAASSGSDRQGAVIPVIQARGGIGSTTVAVNLADQLLARKSRFRKEVKNRVAIVDFDLQFGTVGDFLDVDPQDSIMKMASGGVVPDALWVEQSLSQTPSGLRVLTAPADFMPIDSINDAQIKALVDALRQSHDYVVIDLPRAVLTWIAPIMSMADQAIIVSDTTVPSVRATKRLIDLYKGENPTLEFKVVINHEKKPMVQSQHHKEAARVLNQKFEHWLPDDPKAARLATDYGKPLSEVAPRSDLGKAIANLAKATMRDLPMVEHAGN